MSSSPKSVGILGGTFNPVHVGHLRAAEEVAEALELEKVLFVPSAEPPHKGPAALAPAELRLAWVEAAVLDNPRFEVDAVEIQRGGPSYSVDTLRDLGERLAPGHPVFLIGYDAFAEIGSWRDPEAVFELASFAVMTRPPAVLRSLADALPAAAASAFEVDADGVGRHRDAATWVRLVEISALDISASDIRGRIRAGASVRYLLPEPVRQAVLESGVYERS
jgi:nicotinate-nucleotide adenylyltransferase